MRLRHLPGVLVQILVSGVGRAVPLVLIVPDCDQADCIQERAVHG
jgi:hypothetical protein